MNILIADDHTVVRAGLRQILLTDFPNAQLDEATCYDEVLQKIQNETLWDLVILDMSMPGGNGLDLLKQIKEKNQKLPVLVLSMYSEEQFGLRALKCGASGYLNKESAPLELVSAVRSAIEGRRYVSPALASKLASVGNEEDNATPWHSLSEREMFVLRSVYEGLALKEIAARLEISTKTVSTYRQRVLKKLNLSTNADLVQYVIKNNLFGSNLALSEK